MNRQLYDKFYNNNPVWPAATSSTGLDYAEINFENKARAYAWGWSYYGNSLIDMYLAIGDLQYLHDFVPQVNHILNQRDHLQDNVSFTGSELSLSVWSDQTGYFSNDKSSVYAYPVHTGAITLLMIRFSNVVLKNSLVDFYEQAFYYIEEVGKSLKAHDFEDIWHETNINEGFYTGLSYGKGNITEAGKIGVPNRVFTFLASAALYDALAGDEYFKDRLVGSLNYFTNNYLNYNKAGDFYYWSYWNEDDGEESWEDISHAALTIYALHLIHYEAGFEFFSDRDFNFFSNTFLDIIDMVSLNNNSPRASKFINIRDFSSAF